MTLRRYAYGALLAAGNSYDYLHGHGFSQLTVRTVMVRKDGLGTQFCTVCKVATDTSHLKHFPQIHHFSERSTFPVGHIENN